MRRIVTAVLFASLLMLGNASNLCAQEQPQWKVGDKVEILNLSKEWVPGAVIGIVDWREYGRGIRYRVKLDDANASTVYFNSAPASDMRARGDQPADNPVNRETVGDSPSATAGEFKVGDRVDAYYNERQGKNRGTIVEAKAGRYKVHYNGCKAFLDDWIDQAFIHRPATISSNAPEITFLFGKWALTKVGISSYNVAWGKANGVQINGDGTFIWYQDGGVAPVKGKWTTDARVPGADMGTQNFDGVLIKDAAGQDWKVFKWVVKGSPDGVEVQRMCSGEAIVGSSVR